MAKTSARKNTAAPIAKGGGTSTCSSFRTSLVVALLFSMILQRVLVGFHAHSGQDNHHGKAEEGAYGGDYEAQRHWMELTLHLPINQWYKYDLRYWGLDYPPLTAYVSYVCGWFSHVLVGPYSMALDQSRGLEDAVLKSYMRATVLLLDVAIYFPPLCFLARRIQSTSQQQQWWTLLLGLSQPAIVLIDHGHFQYNTVALGFALWSFYFITRPNFANCIVGSIFFCLALNFKQMTLYYATAVFAYLLGRCFRQNPESEKHSASPLIRFVLLGVTVLASFAALWWPFVLLRTKGETTLEVLQHMLHRIFPFERGLFEGKVANLWCALSVRPIAIRRRIPPQLHSIVALATTFFLLLPPCIQLFRVGAGGVARRRVGSKVPRDAVDVRALLWGCTANSLAFFLASFQVHEKSILMSLASLSPLLSDDASFVGWFSILSAWTLWPLLQIDRLHVPYVACGILFLCLLVLYQQPLTELAHYVAGRKGMANVVWGLILAASLLAMIALHIFELVVVPPSSLPDLFPVLWSLVGCAGFSLSWLYTTMVLWRSFGLSAPPRSKID